MPTTPRILSPDQVALLRALQVPPDAVTLAGVAVAAAAASKRYPAKSLRAALRHLAAFGLPDEVIARIEEIAWAKLPNRQTTALGSCPVDLWSVANLRVAPCARSGSACTIHRGDAATDGRSGTDTAGSSSLKPWTRAHAPRSWTLCRSRSRGASWRRSLRSAGSEYRPPGSSPEARGQ
jgi:hypothetical protein